MPNLPKPGHYRHFKGTVYEVFAVACHSETEEALVIYRPLDGDGSWWARPATMFGEMVEVDGQRVARFERVA